MSDDLHEVAVEVLNEADTGSPYQRFVGQRVAIYGPNFIWTGEMVAYTWDTVTLKDVHQVFDTGEHSSSTFDGEKCCEVMVFQRGAICNLGSPRWA